MSAPSFKLVGHIIYQNDRLDETKKKYFYEEFFSRHFSKKNFKSMSNLNNFISKNVGFRFLVTLPSVIIFSLELREAYWVMTGCGWCGGTEISFAHISTTVCTSGTYDIPKCSGRWAASDGHISVSGFDHFHFRFAVFCVFLDLGASERKMSE